MVICTGAAPPLVDVGGELGGALEGGLLGVLGGLEGAEDLAATTSDNPVEAVVPPESRTMVANVKDPACAGVPEIVPLDELRLKPVGNCPPDVTQEYGGTPPVTAKVAV